MAATPDPKPDYRIGWITGGILVGFTVVIHIIMFFIDLIPGVDLIDWIIWLMVDLPIKVYFLIKLGTSGYLGGKKQGQKIATTVITTVIGFIPIIDGLIPEMTIEVLGIILATRAEDKLKAKEKAEAQKKAAEMQNRMSNRAARAPLPAANDAGGGEFSEAA